MRWQKNSIAGQYKGNIKKLWLYKLLLNLDFFSGVLIPFFIDWGRISFTQVMILQSWFMFWIFILEVPSGVIADKIGRKKTLIISALAFSIGPLVYASYPNFYVFLLGELFFAIGLSFSSGAIEALLYDSLKQIGREKDSKNTFLRLGSFSRLGILISAPLGSIIAKLTNIRIPMLITFIPYFIALIVALFLKEPPVTKVTEKKDYKTIFYKGLKNFSSNKVLRLLALDLLVISTTAYFWPWLYQLILMRLGISIALFGVVHSLLVLSQIIILHSIPRIESWFKSKKAVLLLGGLVNGIMFIITAITKNAILGVLAIIIGAGFGLTRSPLITNYLNKYIGSQERATTLSMVSMLRRIMLIIINPLIGALAQWSLSTALIILGSVSILYTLFSSIEEEHLID